MKCEYCQSENQSGEICNRCGAKLPKVNNDVWKSEPFFYNGYICYCLKDYSIDSLEVQFWLGLELIERICVTRELIDSRVAPNEDKMSFFWELFLIAHGEKDVLEWQEKNNKYPAVFLITRRENPEKERIRSLSMYDIAQEARR